VAEPTRGMGRGLAALLAPTDGEREPELREIPVELIAPNPAQPRRHFDEAGLVALADSLRARGILQPVLLRPRPGGSFELIAGERRWRAAQLAGFETVPALVRSRDDAASLELALIENMAREDLNPVEEARACALLVDELGLTREEIGRRVGRSRVAVSNLMRLLDLPDDVLDLLATGQLSEGHGRALLTAPDHDDRRRLARRAVDRAWSVRETEARARDAAAPRESSPPPPPDQIELAARLAEALSRALGADVNVVPRGPGYRISFALDGAADALALADRLAPGPALSSAAPGD
jgi:ParB family transcriptional regulator, chromosome partitioning protein